MSIDGVKRENHGYSSKDVILTCALLNLIVFKPSYNLLSRNNDDTLSLVQTLLNFVQCQASLLQSLLGIFEILDLSVSNPLGEFLIEGYVVFSGKRADDETEDLDFATDDVDQVLDKVWCRVVCRNHATLDETGTSVGVLKGSFETLTTNIVPVTKPIGVNKLFHGSK